jgi:NitT/TauT family transport system substrate-binding protein
LALIIALLVFVVACGGGAQQPAKPAAEPAKPAAQPAAPAAKPAEPAKPAAQPAKPAAEPAKPAQMKKMTIATGIDAAFAHFVVAAKKGFMEKYGVQADYKPFDDGNVALDALLTGNSDMGGTSEFGGIVRRAKGGKLYVAGLGASSKEQIGIAGKDTITKPEDFIGKKVGFPQASGGHYYFLRYVQKYGLDRSKITHVNLQAPESVAALRRGDIDAMFLWEPWLTRATREVPNTKIIARSGDNDVFTLMIYTYVSERFVNDKELATGAMKGLIDASKWMMQNKDETAQILSQAYNIPLEDAKLYVGRFEYSTRWTPEIRKNLEEAAGILKDLKVITDVPKSEEWLRPDILKAAAPEVVKE